MNFYNSYEDRDDKMKILRRRKIIVKRYLIPKINKNSFQFNICIMFLK